MMTKIELIEAAECAERPCSHYTHTKRWLPVVEVLRGKGWGWGEIYDWLKELGEPVQGKRHTFVASMSRSHRIWRANNLRSDAVGQ